jgi:hypothetical protein
MLKIKLLILSLTSILFVACSNNKLHKAQYKYSLAYISGGYDGLLLYNLLNNHLKNSNLLDSSSKFRINASISHVANVYVTNIDNTSDRENITTSTSFSIINTEENCLIKSDNFTISQFYIYASSDKYFSNQTAIKEIKKNNTEEIIKKIISQLNNSQMQCKK